MGGNTPAKTVTYTFDDIVANLNAIQPYDWAALLDERLTSKAPHAPLSGITNGGYRIAYTDEANEFLRAADTRDRGVNAWFSLGITVADNVIGDVLLGSPAYGAGLGPGMRLVAINGRRASEELLRTAIRDAKGTTQPIELIVENSGFFKTVRIDYHGGERFPHLVRESNTPAYLDDILKPMAAQPKK